MGRRIFFLLVNLLHIKYSNRNWRMPKSMEETTKVFSPSQNLKIFEYKGSGSFFGTIQKLYLSPKKLSNLSSFFSVGCSIINRNKLLPIYRNKIQENNKKVPMCIKVRYH